MWPSGPNRSSTALRAEQLTQPPAVAAAYAATVRSQVAVLTTLNAEIDTMQGEVAAHFGQHPDAEIYLSQPGLGVILGARVLAEFGDDPHRYADAKARKNYAGTSPITRQSGKQKFVLARYVHNDRLLDALGRQAFSALTASPAARAYYDQLSDRGKDHNAALRQLANRLVGILHGCLKTNTPTTNTPPGPPSTPTSLDVLTPWDVSHAAVRTPSHADERSSGSVRGTTHSAVLVSVVGAAPYSPVVGRI